MYDCNDDVLAFHNDEVTLPQPLRTAMRDRRNANRKRLKDRFEREKLSTSAGVHQTRVLRHAFDGPRRGQ
jgi:hypothetical protein